MIEDLNVKEIRKFLRSEKVETINAQGDEIRGIRLLEKLVEHVFNGNNILDSYFSLYNFRIWADHRGIIKNYNQAIKSLPLDEKDKSNYELIYNTLIKELASANNNILNLSKSFNKLNTKIKNEKIKDLKEREYI